MWQRDCLFCSDHTRYVPLSAFRNEGRAESWNAARVCAKSGQLQLRSPKFDRIRAEVGRYGAETIRTSHSNGAETIRIAQIWPKFGGHRQIMVEVGPDLGQLWPGLGQLWPSSADVGPISWPDSDRDRPILSRSRSTRPNICPESAESGSTSTKFGPASADFGPNSANSGLHPATFDQT